jgi:hypothetical protein
MCVAALILLSALIPRSFDLGFRGIGESRFQAAWRPCHTRPGTQWVRGQWSALGHVSAESPLQSRRGLSCSGRSLRSPRPPYILALFTQPHIPTGPIEL